MSTIVGLLVLICDIVAIVDCLKSTKDNGQKAIWIIVILVLPVLGLVAYYFIGRK